MTKWKPGFTHCPEISSDLLSRPTSLWGTWLEADLDSRSACRAIFQSQIRTSLILPLNDSNAPLIGLSRISGDVCVHINAAVRFEASFGIQHNCNARTNLKVTFNKRGAHWNRTNMVLPVLCPTLITRVNMLRPAPKPT